MNRNTTIEEWDDEGEEESGSADSDEAATIDCPHCGCAIIEDAIQCPHCQIYLSGVESGGDPKSLWWVVGVALALIVCVGLLVYWR